MEKFSYLIMSLNGLFQIHFSLCVNTIWEMVEYSPTVTFAYYPVAMTAMASPYFDDSPWWPSMANDL